MRGLIDSNYLTLSYAFINYKHCNCIHQHASVSYVQLFLQKFTDRDHSPGDQHRATNVTANPFEEPETRISSYTVEQIATLQARLNKFLGPEYISSRDGPGGKKVHYIAANQCIQLANEVFGFDGWSSSIREVQVDYVSLRLEQKRSTNVRADMCSRSKRSRILARSIWQPL